MSYKLKNYEKETVINFNREDDIASIYTADEVQIRKYDKFCELYPDDYKLVKEDECSKTYECPRKLIVGGRAPVKKKELTEEEKRIFKDRMKNSRKK